MAKIFTDIPARDFVTGKKVKLEIYTDNDGSVLSMHVMKKK